MAAQREVPRVKPKPFADNLKVGNQSNLQNSDLKYSDNDVPRDLYLFDTADQSELFGKLNRELRCTVCPNQNLADSTADIAVKIKDDMYRQVLAGNQEKEIVESIVKKYGEEILYQPLFHLGTLFLWLGPCLMLILGFVILKKQLKKF